MTKPVKRKVGAASKRARAPKPAPLVEMTPASNAADDPEDQIEPWIVPEQGDFLTKFGLLESDLEKAGITWDELKSIGNHHAGRRHELETTAEYVAATLRRHPSAHSVKSRVKHPANLLEKIVRKRIEEPARVINRANYQAEVTDLIGIRVLHLFKGDWLPIHDFIVGYWELEEPATANIRRGDSEALVEAFEKAGCSINQHRMGYRSVHYLIKSRPARRVLIAELQVRTIFEEAWSEIDHCIRYPYNRDDLILGQYLAMFNSLAGSADEMGTFIQVLRNKMEEWREVQAAAATEHARTVADLKAQIGKLEIDANKRKELEKRVKDLERPVTTPSAAVGVTTGALRITGLDSLYSTNISPFASSAVTVAFTQQRCEKCGIELPFSSFATVGQKRCMSCQMSSTVTAFINRRCKRCGLEIPLSSTSVINDDYCGSCRATHPLVTFTGG